MTFKSHILEGNPRLDQAATGGPSVKRAPPHDDPDAIKRIQRALMALGYSLPRSSPDGPYGEPDGIYGEEVFTVVSQFQRRVFPNDFREWDGRTGKHTLAEMDELLKNASLAFEAKERDQWLACMKKALDDRGIEGELRGFLDARFAHVANFMRNQG